MRENWKVLGNLVGKLSEHKAGSCLGVHTSWIDVQWTPINGHFGAQASVLYLGYVLYWGVYLPLSLI